MRLSVLSRLSAVVLILGLAVVGCSGHCTYDASEASCSMKCVQKPSKCRCEATCPCWKQHGAPKSDQ